MDIITTTNQDLNSRTNEMFETIKLRIERLEAKFNNLPDDADVNEVLAINKALNSSYNSAINLGQLLINASVEHRKLEQHRQMFD